MVERKRHGRSHRLRREILGCNGIQQVFLVGEGFDYGIGHRTGISHREHGFRGRIGRKAVFVAFHEEIGVPGAPCALHAFCQDEVIHPGRCSGSSQSLRGRDAEFISVCKIRLFIRRGTRDGSYLGGEVHRILLGRDRNGALVPGCAARAGQYGNSRGQKQIFHFVSFLRINEDFSELLPIPVRFDHIGRTKLTHSDYRYPRSRTRFVVI